MKNKLKYIFCIFFTIFIPIYGLDAKTGDSSAVVANGMGTTFDEALKDAFRQAVEIGAGGFLKSETIVLNATLLEDKIYKLSTGYISSYTINSVSTNNNLITIRISAKINEVKLQGDVKAVTNIQMIDGQNIFASIFTKNQYTKNYIKGFYEYFDNWQSKYIRCKVESVNIENNALTDNVNISLKIYFIVEPALIEQVEQYLSLQQHLFSESKNRYRFESHGCDASGNIKQNTDFKIPKELCIYGTSQKFDPSLLKGKLIIDILNAQNQSIANWQNGFAIDCLHSSSCEWNGVDEPYYQFTDLMYMNNTGCDMHFPITETSAWYLPIRFSEGQYTEGYDYETQLYPNNEFIGQIEKFYYIVTLSIPLESLKNYKTIKCTVTTE